MSSNHSSEKKDVTIKDIYCSILGKDILANAKLYGEII
jgi:hypothetical protein